MEKITKHFLIGSGVVAAGASAVGAVSYAATKVMVRMALDRELPKIRNLEKAKKRLCGYEENTAFMENLERCGEKLKNMPHEMVHTESYDGERLVGHWFPCENAKRVIVAMHGWRSNWSRDFGTISDFWKKNGCSVLYAEQRGQGLSGGEYISFGMIERYDCREWVNWVNKRCGEVLPVYLAGVSMGATTVLMAAGLELPENVRGIMADCGFTTADAIWKHVAENNLGISYGIRGSIADAMCRKKIRMGTKDYSTLQAMENCSIPVLFAHGASDHFVPVQMTYENYNACKAPKQLLIVPGADHGMSHFMDKERYEQMVQTFWKTYDKGVPYKEMESPQ